MKTWLPLVGGALLVLVGAVWTFQGAGVLPGSFMSGQKLWFLIGLLAAIAGFVLLATGVRNVRARGD
ncbi:MAG TPA: hypothetical protein VJT49_22855 [Amycolatopsis sp.]|uniref:hypothetical protein n=1 Tax=Amycolatopsis sp. TaxID=37632 RepID=UPI002B4A32D8|nr:hypothetical protein [Amycolatopsis sp.]HKS47898.1 hypothetical protein [Amycolatopsis sp.]